MAHTPSPLGQMPAVTPAYSDIPDARADFNLLATLVEKVTVMKFSTRQLRDTQFSSSGTAIVDGMLTVITGVAEIDLRVAGVWKKIYPVTYTGTAVPSNSLGVPGDIYGRYA